MFTLELEQLDGLIHVLLSGGYEVIGPTVRDGAVTLAPIQSVGDLPQGVKDIQSPGAYTLRHDAGERYFGYVVGPLSLKNYLYPSRSLLCRVKGGSSNLSVETPELKASKRAFIGLRGCDLAALAVQDRIFLEGDYVDPLYKANRENAFLVAVNCTAPGGTCFCTSMGTGPRAQGVYDLALTELVDPGRHYFAVEANSGPGEAVLRALGCAAADGALTDHVDALMTNAAAGMGRTLDTVGLKGLLYDARGSSHWEDVASRCMACANCTMVCPTCFCSTIEESTDLTGDTAERWRVWDSCYTMDFSYIHGGSVRKTGASRYRQWITHKLASWHDQFGTSGCVGCGRCITWCPVGIDITSEVAALRQKATAHPNGAGG